MFDAVGRGLAALADTIRAGSQALSPVSANPVPADWTHVTKVDPEIDKQLPLLYPLYLQHTDAVAVGGSRGLSAADTEATFALLDRVSVPAFQEPSDPAHVTERTHDQAAFIAIPEVLNGDTQSLVGTLGKGIASLQDDLVPDLLDAKLPVALPSAIREPLSAFLATVLLRRAVFEAYIIQNPESAAAREAGVDSEDLLIPTEARHRALAADRHLGSEICYLEYSGTYGGQEATAILRELADDLDYARLWYGGGLASRDQVEEILDAGATTVVVGDSFHDIADEEARLCGGATDELDATTSRAAVRDWIETTTDPGETSAASYLSTIPGVDDPTELATRYLTTTVETRLALVDCLSGETPDSWTDIVACGESLPVESDIDDAVAGDTDEFLSNLLAVVADRPDLAPLPVRHVADPDDRLASAAETPR